MSSPFRQKSQRGVEGLTGRAIKCYEYAMKSHISATIDRALLARMERVRREERRSRSQFIELAVEHYLRDRGVGDAIVTSGGAYRGKFDRSETYAR